LKKVDLPTFGRPTIATMVLIDFYFFAKVVKKINIAIKS